MVCPSKEKSSFIRPSNIRISEASYLKVGHAEGESASRKRIQQNKYRREDKSLYAGFWVGHFGGHLPTTSESSRVVSGSLGTLTLSMPNSSWIVTIIFRVRFGTETSTIMMSSGPPSRARRGQPEGGPAMTTFASLTEVASSITSMTASETGPIIGRPDPSAHRTRRADRARGVVLI